MSSVLIVGGTELSHCAECRRLSGAQAGMSLYGVGLDADDGAAVMIVPAATLQQLRTGLWRAQGALAKAPVIAVVCGSQAAIDRKWIDLLSKFDDFLFCTNLECELALRVERLAQRHDGQSRAKTKLSTSRAAAAEPSSMARTVTPAQTPLIGNDPPFLAALQQARRFAQSEATVLICGETGSGKELFARAIHYQSGRSAKPFIPVNCGALPDHLFENELFGHAKGAFTDAATAEPGLIAEAEGGTLFLDEVDGLSAAAQIKLLRFLQSGEYRVLGASRAVHADVRVLAATNCDLRARVAAKLFREDLFYRLNVLVLAVPALRERPQDILSLAEHFLSEGQDAQCFQLSAAARQKLQNYRWPGNVRELAGLIQRAMALCSGEVLQAADIELPKGVCREAFERESLHRAKSVVVGEFERRYVADLLAQHQGNVSQAARAAGKNRRTLQRLLRKYDLDRLEFTKA